MWASIGGLWHGLQINAAAHFWMKKKKTQTTVFFRVYENCSIFLPDEYFIIIWMRLYTVRCSLTGEREIVSRYRVTREPAECIKSLSYDAGIPQRNEI